MRINKPSNLAGILVLLGAILASAVNATVTVKYSAILDTLPDYFHGVNYVGFWDDIQGSVGSRDALRRAGVQLIRFPGGVPGDYYDWTNPTKVPQSTTSPAILSAYAQAVGAKVLFQTNAGCGDGSTCTPQHAANWVSFCKTNNIPVYLWEVGNEPEWWSGTGPRPGEYFDIYKAQSTAMHAVDPTAKIIGPATNFLYLAKKLADTLGIANVNGFSIHWYGASGWNTVRQSAQVSWPAVGAYMNSINAVKRPWFVTEWSVLGATLDAVANPFNQQIGAALAYMDCIGMFTRLGMDGYFMFGCIHGVMDNWGILGGRFDIVGEDEPGPSYFVLPIATKLGNMAIDLDNTDNDSTVLSAYATRKKATIGAQVLMINKTNVARSTTINFIGYNPTGATVEAYELKPTTGGVTATSVTYNGVPRVMPATSELPLPTSSTCSGTSLTRSLPAYSATLLNFKGGVVGNKVQLPVDLGPARITISNQNRIVTVSWTSNRIAKNASLAVYDIRGKMVGSWKTPVTANQFVWEARDISTGSYVMRINIEGETTSREVLFQ